VREGVSIAAARPRRHEHLARRSARRHRAPEPPRSPEEARPARRRRGLAGTRGTRRRRQAADDDRRRRTRAPASPELVGADRLVAAVAQRARGARTELHVEGGAVLLDDARRALRRVVPAEEDHDVAGAVLPPDEGVSRQELVVRAEEERLAAAADEA